MKCLSANNIVTIHEQMIAANELQGMASETSIEAIIASINNRITYAMICDVYELAAC